MEALSADRLVLYAAMALPMIALVVRANVFPEIRGAWLFLFSSLAVYVLLLASVQLLDARLAEELSAFDLDGDGSFSRREMTPAADEAMRRVVADAGRRFAPYTGVVYALLYVAIVFGLARLLALLRRTIRR